MTTPDDTATLDKKWLPSHYQDESIPPPRPSPSDWVTQVGDTFYLIGPGDDEEADAILTDGQMMHFEWTAVLGEGEVTVELDDHEDRTVHCSIAIPVAPPGCSLHMMEPKEFEYVCDNLETFAEDLRPGDHPRLIIFYTWSDGIPFRFQSGQFVAVKLGGENVR